MPKLRATFNELEKLLFPEGMKGSKLKIQSEFEYCYLVGKNIRKYRKQKNYTQKRLGDKVGCSFQQIQKYETGVQKITVCRLHLIANALNRPLTDFIPV